MTSHRTSAVALADKPHIVMERWINAPRGAVWRAWTTPEAITRWWGPHGTQITVHEMDFRVGGTLRFNMKTPDGTDYANRIRYRELKAPARIAMTVDGDKDNDPNAFKLEVDFVEQDGGTLVRILSIMASMEAREFVRGFGAVELGQQTWDKLADFVEHGADVTVPDALLVRTLQAKRDLVWRMWTEPKHFMRWWGPHGFDCPEAQIAPKPGSPIRLAMRNVASGDTHYATGEVLAVDAPRRLVLRLRAFGTDAEPGIEHVTVVTLCEFRGATTMQVETRIERLAPELREAAKGMGEGMSQGFEKMAAAVASG